VDPRLSAPSLREVLLAARNPDGGWPYYPKHDSRLEPTVWALLAIARDAGRPPDIDVITRWPRKDGWLVDGPAGAPVNFAFNAIAALGCLQAPGATALVTGLARLIVQARGITLEQNDVQRQDNSLQAWPWIDQTFSWVEPTAWCMLLLKKGRALGIDGAADRITVAEKLIRDRVCHDGGWNYGGSNVYGQELYAYVPTTAITLMAMQDRRDDPVVVKSLEFLKTNAHTEPTTEALGLTMTCFSIYGLPTEAIRKQIQPAIEISRVREHVLGLAMALYAVGGGTHGMDAFRV
jgi:hypothetical protein